MNSCSMLGDIARITLLSGKMFNTDNLAVPIPMVDPTDIFGIVETNTSVTIPAAVYCWSI